MVRAFRRRTFSRAIPLALALVIFGAGVAAAKPAIAVLGIEVVDKSGTPTPADTQVATELTSGLRSRAKAGTGTYQLAPGSDKELIDEKLLKNCDDEKPACMAQIGSELGADALMYGKIEKQGGAYLVTISLLDVRRKTRERAYPDSIPLSEAQGAALQGWAEDLREADRPERQLHRRRQDQRRRGSRHDPDRWRGEGEHHEWRRPGRRSRGGSLQGRRRGEDFHRWEKADVTCTAGQTVNLAAELQRIVPLGVGGVGPGGQTTGTIDLSHSVTGTVSQDDSLPWKAFTITGTVATGVLAVGLVYSRSQLEKTGPASGFFKYGSNCSDDGMGGYNVKNGTTVDDCRHAGTYSTLTFVSGIGTAVAGGFTLFALIKTVTSHSSEQQPVAGRRVRKPAIAVKPVFDRNGGGATLEYDW